MDLENCKTSAAFSERSSYISTGEAICFMKNPSPQNWHKGRKSVLFLIFNFWPKLSEIKTKPVLHCPKKFPKIQMF